MVRGTGKFKQKRGGGRNFSKDMTLDANGTAVGSGTIYNRRGPRKNEDDEDDSDEDEESGEEEEESEEEESGEEETPGAGKAPAQELTRAERREQKRKQAADKQKGADDEDEDLINPNRVEKKLNISDLGAPRELSRREREQKEKADAKERYWKLHVQGKTLEAKADLSRLAKIREEREAAQAKRKAETEAKAAEAEAKRKAQMSKRG
ncbi:casein kinase substrate phosphoprotein PP28-domain-containing protein [Lyophyllum atratum]|nr:casein kinase substrate phosphoprotein PP28-domain-containing protein [Lyophyllum atratum]